MKVIDPEKMTGTVQPNRISKGLVNREMGSSRVRVNLNVITSGTGDNWHKHAFSEQCHYVLKGQLTITTAQGARVLKPGMMDWIPAGEDHQVQNTAKGDTHYMTITAPPPES